MTVFPSDSAISWPGGAAGVEPYDHLADVVARCLDGDEGAYAILYDHFAPLLYRLSYSLLQNREDAEEVLQDGFEYAFRKLALYDPRKASLKTWLYQIVISRCRNKRRRKWLPTFSFSQLMSDEAADPKSLTPDEAAALSLRQKAIWNALGQLSDKLRETAVLRYYEGLSYSEIGAILDIPAATAESRMRLAHKSLRDLLADEMMAEG